MAEIKLFAVVNAEGIPITVSWNKSNPYYHHKGHATRALKGVSSWMGAVKVEEFIVVPKDEYDALIKETTKGGSYGS